MQSRTGNGKAERNRVNAGSPNQLASHSKEWKMWQRRWVRRKRISSAAGCVKNSKQRRIGIPTVPRRPNEAFGPSWETGRQISERMALGPGTSIIRRSGRWQQCQRSFSLGVKRSCRCFVILAKAGDLWSDLSIETLEPVLLRKQERWRRYVSLTTLLPAQEHKLRRGQVELVTQRLWSNFLLHRSG